MRSTRVWLWRAGATFGGAVAAVLGGALVLGCGLFSAPPYHGARSPHFDGEKFLNPGPGHVAGFVDFLHWQLHRQRGVWSTYSDAAPGPPPPLRVGRGELRVTFINHATVLLQMDGLNILTDPIWSERVGPVSFAGPKRHRPPGIRFDDLPPIDVVLLSHNHYDHTDLPTLRRLWRRDRPHVYGGLGQSALLEKAGLLRNHDLDWWQSAQLAQEVSVTSVPARHFSGRGLCDRDTVLWTGFVIVGPAGAVYFAGDTGFGDHFADVRQRFGPMRLALLPIGAYLPRWFMSPVHLSPNEAVQAHLDLGAQISVPIHFGTFELADDGEQQPVEDLYKALAERGVSRERFWVLGFGEGRAVPPLRGKAQTDEHDVQP